MRRLVMVSQYLGRGSDIESLFVADEADWAKIQRWCEQGNSCYFGEICGKHSDVEVTFELKDFRVISEDEVFIDKFETIVGDFGHSILDRMCNRCEDCDEEIGDDDEVCEYCQEERDATDD